MRCQRCDPFPPTILLSDYNSATFCRQALLQDRLTDLEDLIRSEDGQAVSQDIQKLVTRVLSEIESWFDRGEGPMSFEAQITLSNMSCNGPNNDIICNQFSCKVQQIYPIDSTYLTYCITWD